MYNSEKDIQINNVTSGLSNSISTEIHINQPVQTAFHTHPIKEIPIDPPSSVDIAFYISTIVEYIKNILKNNNRDIRVESLIVQNEIVFSTDGVYVYYVSYPLIRNIISQIKQCKSFEYIEMNYVGYIMSVQPKFISDKSTLHHYFKQLRKIGIIINRYNYDNVESYIL
jgi:hypothetical protein